MRRVVAVLLGSVLCVATDAQPLALPWRAVPVPHGGSFSGIVETAPGHVLAATDGTVYRSEDEGMTWRPTALPSVRRMRRDAGEVLALSSHYPAAGSSLYRSADGGRSWRRHAFAVDVWDARRTPQGRLFVVTEYEVLGSLDDGATWQPLLRRPYYRIQSRLSLTPDGWPFVGVGLPPMTDSLMAYDGSAWKATVLPRHYPLPGAWTDTFESPDGTQYVAVKGGVYRRDAAAGWKRLVRRTAYTLAVHNGRILAGAADGIYGVEGDTGRVAATPAKVGTLHAGLHLWAATDWYAEGFLRTSVRPPDGAYRVDSQGQLVRLPVGAAVEGVDAVAATGARLYVLGDGLWRIDPQVEGWTRLDPPTSVFDAKGEVFDGPLSLTASPDGRWLLLVSWRGDEGGPPLYRFGLEEERWAPVRVDGRPSASTVMGITPGGAVLLKDSYRGAPVRRCTGDEHWTCQVVSGGPLVGAANGRVFAVGGIEPPGSLSLLRSSDDGVTWETTGIPYSGGHMVADGRMIRMTTRSSPSRSTTIAHSNDEGRTWMEVARVEGVKLSELHYGSGGRIAALTREWEDALAGSTDALYLTDDFGRHWYAASMPAGSAGAEVDLGPGDDLFVFGTRIWRTPWPTATAVETESVQMPRLSVAPNPF